MCALQGHWKLKYIHIMMRIFSLLEREFSWDLQQRTTNNKIMIYSINDIKRKKIRTNLAVQIYYAIVYLQLYNTGL